MKNSFVAIVLTCGLVGGQVKAVSVGDYLNEKFKQGVELISNVVTAEKQQVVAAGVEEIKQVTHAADAAVEALTQKAAQGAYEIAETGKAMGLAVIEVTKDACAKIDTVTGASVKILEDVTHKSAILATAQVPVESSFGAALQTAPTSYLPYIKTVFSDFTHKTYVAGQDAVAYVDAFDTKTKVAVVVATAGVVGAIAYYKYYQNNSKNEEVVVRRA